MPASGESAATDGQALTIGDVARSAGLQTSAIRYYERVGLIPAPERQGGQRRYESSVLERLAVIGVAKRAGFSLDEIRELLSGFDPKTPPRDRWRQMAAAKLEELDAAVERIEGMRALLRRGVECGCLTLEDCRLLQPPGVRSADSSYRA